MPMDNRARVVVAMSGGVDSSVAAALLVQQGYDVVGMMLRLWSEPGKDASNRCCTPDAMAMARRVAAELGIPFYAVDAKEVFRSRVVQYFIDSYTQGDTPNPCLVCNRHVRWEFLLERALALGASAMATGHYVRVQHDSQSGYRLLKGVDPLKDQSYVLHVLNQSQLAHALFPLGELTKSQVRQLAHDFKLPVADRAESQDLCFLADSDYRSFLVRNVPGIENPGPILTRDGKEIGRHQGLAFYTIGQRKGLGVASQVPLYVLQKDMAGNALIVAPVEQLGKRSLLAGQLNWVSGKTPAQRFRAQVKIRYKARPAWGDVSLLVDDQALVRFDEPLRDITSGQAAVFYDGDYVIGGGAILSAD
jgi:tRNA-uridine 2-sulfurtransferase